MQTRLPEAKRSRLPGRVLRILARRRRRIPTFLRAISRMSITRKNPFVAMVLVTACAIVPVRSYACEPGAALTGSTSEVQTLARQINARGFAQIALGNPAPNEDVVAAPFTTWYLDQFLSPDWHTRQDSVAATLVAEVTSKLNFSASLGANRATTSFSPRDADEARRVLCTSTSWSPADGYDFSIQVSVLGEATFPASVNSRFVHVPFFSDGDISGVRMDSGNGDSLLLFWTTSPNVDKLRSVLASGRWDSMMAEFQEDDVLLDPIAFERSLKAVLESDSPGGFGFRVAPGLSPWDDLPVNLSLSVTRAGAEFRIDESLFGYSTMPKRAPSDGNSFTVSARSVNADFATPVPDSRRFSSLRPMIYVVINRATGCILLVGIHT